MPAQNFPYNVSLFRSMNEWSILGIVEDYLSIGKPEKAVAVGNQLAHETLQSLLYYSTPTGPGDDDVINKRLADDAATIYYYLIRLYNNFGRSEDAKGLEEMLKAL
jgi:hypothetical protein